MRSEGVIFSGEVPQRVSLPMKTSTVFKTLALASGRTRTDYPSVGHEKIGGGMKAKSSARELQW